MTEVVYGLTDSAANLVQEMADEFKQRLPPVGRRTRRVGPISSKDKCPGVTGCVPCVAIAGDLSVDIDDVMHPTLLAVTPLCGGDRVVLEYDSDDGNWKGSMTLDCGSGPMTWALVIDLTGLTAGLVVFTATSGAFTITWKNLAAYQPGYPLTSMAIFDGTDEGCPCAPWDDFPCVLPMDPPE